MYRRTKFLLTQSLLGSWLYQYDAADPEKAHVELIKTLKRGKSKPNRAMLDGIQFENMVTAYCDGSIPDREHKWFDGICGVGELVKGSQFQVAAYRDKNICGLDFLLYGRLDALKAGTIYDIKFSRTYEPGKYLDSPQHPMYFECVPEAKTFTYVIYTGKDVCTETYRREEISPVDETVRQFIGYLEDTGLAKIYIENWKARN